MFGTVWRARVKPGQEAAFEAFGRRWSTERAPATTGFIAEYLVRSSERPGEVAGIVIFDSEANYRALAADPAQDRWYQELRATLEADPEWFDGQILTQAELVAL
jgi:hypothetical protein